jgi:hypothetical protein
MAIKLLCIKFANRQEAEMTIICRMAPGIPAISVLTDTPIGQPGGRTYGLNDSPGIVMRGGPARAQKVWCIA